MEISGMRRLWRGIAQLWHEKTLVEFQGSNDGETWTNLAAQIVWSFDEHRGTHKLKNTKAFCYHRLSMTKLRTPPMKALRFVCPDLVAAWEDFAADREIRAMIRRAEKDGPALVTREQMVEDGWRQQDVEYYESLLRQHDRTNTGGE